MNKIEEDVIKYFKENKWKDIIDVCEDLDIRLEEAHTIVKKLVSNDVLVGREDVVKSNV